MKKTILLMLLVSFCFTSQITVAGEPVTLTFQRNNNGSLNGDPDRTPLQIPLQISYDRATSTINISAPSDLEAEVYIYDPMSFVVFYSDVLRSTIDMSSLAIGNYTLVITNSSWEATGIIAR